MKFHVLCVTGATVASLFTGCISPDGTPNRTGTGALLGGALGATTGALIGGPRHGVEGALIGGALGAVTGGSIGDSMDVQERARLRARAPQTVTRIEQRQPLGVADVKSMSTAGLSDDVIISQIRNTHTTYRLSAADIIDLHNSGVSQRVIDFMINTATQTTATATVTQTVVAEAPPPPPADPIVVAPAPGYIWIGGEWEWHGRWVWASGRWAYPPHPGALWVSGVWIGGPHGYRRSPGHWR